MGPDDVRKLLLDDLGAQGGEDLVTDEAPGPLGTLVLTARAREGLYPGQNARVAVLDGARAYGALLGPGLGALLRDRGLDPRSLPAATLVTLHNLTAFDGALVVSEDAPPSRVTGPTSVDVIRFVALDPMSGGASTHDLVIPDDGPIELRAAPETGAPVVPLTRAVGLARALEQDDAMALMAALAALSPPLTDDERALLARATAVGNEAIAYDAIARLDASPASAAALGDATRDDPPARARVVALASAAHGAAFAELVRDVR
ncbi:MAG: hypothetical protein IT385_15425 [Deltaproteobacteria bacterium]|nr:hypothetical protein [Deltaproteobacteria bacterium]